MPHELSVKNNMDQLNIICDTLLKRNVIELFLKRIIMGDEKWIKYENLVWKRSWKKRDERSQTTSKLGLTANKIMLCVYMVGLEKGIVHYELLSLSQTINSVLYCEQLERLREAIERKRPELMNRKGVVFHHDNAHRPHTSLMTRQKLRELLAAKFWCIHRIAQTSHPQITTCFDLRRTLFMESSLLQETPVKTTHFVNQKPQKFYTDGMIWLCPKNDETLS